MKFAEINRRFTEKVAEYMVKGYTINTASMRGTQGEIGKVDLTDGKVIVRVLLDNMYSGCERVGDRYYSFDGYSLIVGIVTDGARPNDTNDYKTVWNNHLDVIYKEDFYEIGRYGKRRWKDSTERWFGTREEAIAQMDKQDERRDDRRQDVSEVPEKAKEIALKAVRKVKGFKTARISDITNFVKRTTDHGSYYVVQVKGKEVRISA